MGDVTQILSAIESGDGTAAEQLLPLIYDELRRLAAQKMAGESPDHTLQATALVHDAYLRLVDVERAQHWDSRGHFFAAAAEAMRRILVESVRRKSRIKHGGCHNRVELEHSIAVSQSGSPVELLDLDEALKQLEIEEPAKAELIKLRFFAGLSMDAAAAILGISSATATRDWCYARAWLYRRMSESE